MTSEEAYNYINYGDEARKKNIGLRRCIEIQGMLSDFIEAFSAEFEEFAAKKAPHGEA